MSADIVTALANEALEQSYLFRQNAALNRGLPDCRRHTIGGIPQINLTIPEKNTEVTEAVPVKETTEVKTETPSPGGGAAEPPQQSLLRRAAPFIVTAATGAGLPMLAYYGFHKEPPPPQLPPAPVVQPADGSLLQYLQDQGKHLPGGQWQTK